MRYTPVLIFFLAVLAASNPALAQPASAGAGLIKDLIIPTEGNQNKLKVVVAAQKRCMFGDLDLISLDLQHSKKDLRLQLSLEPIVAGAAEPVFGTPVQQNNEGTLGTYEFLLPRTDKPVLMGLYICSYPAADETRPCGSLPLKSFEQMFDKYQFNMDEASKEAEKTGKLPKVPHQIVQDPNNPGNIYFFRFLIVSDSLVEFPVKAMNVNRYNQFFRFARQRGIATSEIEDIIVQQSRQLISVPLTTSENALKVILPYYDRNKCSPPS